MDSMRQCRRIDSAHRAILGSPERYPLDEVLDERTAPEKIFGEQNPGPFG
jgi:hypothetical protein